MGSDYGISAQNSQTASTLIGKGTALLPHAFMKCKGKRFSSLPTQEDLQKTTKNLSQETPRSKFDVEAQTRLSRTAV
jgi:hypothetical protein